MNKTEQHVAQKAIEEFNRISNENKYAEEFLQTKKFPLGTIVIKKGESYFDSVFEVYKDSVGKIVGWDFENNYYRVYYSSLKPYVGTDEESIDKFAGEIPEHLLNHKNVIKRIIVNL